MARDIREVSATGDVIAGPAMLHSVSVASNGAAAATVAIRDGAAGAVKLTLRTPAAGPSARWRARSRGVLFASAIHATLTGTGAVVSCEYS